MHDQIFRAEVKYKTLQNAKSQSIIVNIINKQAKAKVFRFTTNMNTAKDRLITDVRCTLLKYGRF